MRRFPGMSNVVRTAIVATAATVAAGLVSDSYGARQTVTERGIRFSFDVPQGWERFRVATGKHPRGPISLNKSVVGPQGAEGIIYWTSFPAGDYADPCAQLLGPSIGRSAAALAVAVAKAPGTKLVEGPSNVALGGHPAKHVVLKIRKNIGCDPGFFYGWANYRLGGAFWHMKVGDTIRVWILPVGGTRLVIEAATNTLATSSLRKEIQQIVESIRFDPLVTR
jgi:hypothetical protein